MAPWFMKKLAELPAAAGALPAAAAVELLTAMAAAMPPMTATPAMPPSRPVIAPALEDGG